MTDNFWKPYRESTKRYMPTITSVRWVRRFQVGSYRAIVGTDCDNVGGICYIHVMYVFRENDDQPYMAVVSEYALGQVSAESPFFCLFFGGSHFNMGSSSDYVDLEIFTQKALKTIIEPLGVQSGTPKELPLN